MRIKPAVSEERDGQGRQDGSQAKKETLAR
jgi:hypothetical protein